MATSLYSGAKLPDYMSQHIAQNVWFNWYILLLTWQWLHLFILFLTSFCIELIFFSVKTVFIIMISISQFTFLVDFYCWESLEWLHLSFLLEGLIFICITFLEALKMFWYQNLLIERDLYFELSQSKNPNNEMRPLSFIFT